MLGPVDVHCLSLWRELTPPPLRNLQTLSKRLPIRPPLNLHIPSISLLRKLWLRSMRTRALLKLSNVRPRTLPAPTLRRPAGLLSTSRPIGLSKSPTTVRCACLLLESIPIPPTDLLGLLNTKVFSRLCTPPWTLFPVILLTARNMARPLLNNEVRPRVKHLTRMPRFTARAFLRLTLPTTYPINADPFLLPPLMKVIPLFCLTARPVPPKIIRLLQSPFIFLTTMGQPFEWGEGGNPRCNVEALLLLILSSLSPLSTPMWSRIRRAPEQAFPNCLTNLPALVTNPRRLLQVPRRRLWCLPWSLRHPEQPIPQLHTCFTAILTAWAATPLMNPWLRSTMTIVPLPSTRKLLSYRTDLTLRRPAGLLSNSMLGPRSNSPVSLTCTCYLLSKLSARWPKLLCIKFSLSSVPLILLLQPAELTVQNPLSKVEIPLTSLTQSLSLQLACALSLPPRCLTLVLTLRRRVKVRVVLRNMACLLLATRRRGRQVTISLPGVETPLWAGRSIFVRTPNNASPFVLPPFTRVTWLPLPTMKDTLSNKAALLNLMVSLLTETTTHPPNES